MSVIEAQKKIREWRDNPTQFVWDNFKVKPDVWQKDCLDALKDKKKFRIALKACAGPGKTAVLSWAGWWFLSCWAEPGDHPKGLAVSVTRDNLRDNLWPELSKWQNRSEFLKFAFTWTKERIYANDHPETWFLAARSWPQGASEEEMGATLSGIHSGFNMFLIDESGKIPIAVARAAEQAVSSAKRVWIIQAGNPLTQDGMLYDAATRLRHLWHMITITGDPDDPKRSPRIDLQWAKEQIEAYGRDNPWVMAYILGEFPPGGINTLLSVEEVEAAMNRHLREDQYDFSQKRLGVDVARFGLDSTVLFPRQGLSAFKQVRMQGARSNDIAARVMMAREKWGQEFTFVDGTGGYGSGVIDSLIQAGQEVNEVNFSGKSLDARYFNKRSEMWFLMADWVKRGGAMPYDANLLRQLTVATYTFQNGKFRLEEKDQMVKRLNLSPDDADALALTFALPEMPASTDIISKLIEKDKGKVVKDFDPLEC